MKSIINKVKSFFKKEEVKIEKKQEDVTPVRKGPLHAYRTNNN